MWKKPLPPGKYPLNPFALKVELVPTVNFVLRWITGQIEAHQYDKDLTSIDLITADGYEPVLPLSLVLHIDYEKAPRVVQRFGDVQAADQPDARPDPLGLLPRRRADDAMLDLLTHREEIQSARHRGARPALPGLRHQLRRGADRPPGVEAARRRARTRSSGSSTSCGAPARRRAEGDVREPAGGRRQAARAERRARAADKQTELTQTRIDVEIAGNKGEAQLAEARRLAERDVARADGEARARELLGRGEASRIAQVGLAEAGVFLQKIRAYGDPRLFALNLVAEQFAHSAQPLVPERVL